MTTYSELRPCCRRHAVVGFSSWLESTHFRVMFESLGAGSQDGHLNDDGNSDAAKEARMLKLPL